MWACRDILGVLPQAKQVLAFSATYRADLLNTLHGLMRSPQHIILSTDTLTVKGTPLFLFPIFLFVILIRLFCEIIYNYISIYYYHLHIE